MSKNKTSFLVTVWTNKPVSATLAADKVREALSGQKMWYSDGKKRESTSVVKVTLRHVGEK